jgi:guanylate kinase
LNLKKIFGERALAIFVQPPSVNELERRLRHRSTETDEKIKQRVGKAQLELARAKEFDVIIVNDDLEHAIREAAEKVKSFIQ